MSEHNDRASRRRKIARQLRNEGWGTSVIAAELGVAPSTVNWLLKTDDATAPTPEERHRRKIASLAKRPELLAEAIASMSSAQRHDLNDVLDKHDLRLLTIRRGRISGWS